MPNDSSLPRPNIPQPPSGAGSTPTPSGAVGGQAGAQTITPPPKTPLASSNSEPIPPAPVMPSGLDTQYPGGAPPELNEQGQVTRTSTISQTREAPTFDQPQAAPQSTMQKIQASSADKAAAAAASVPRTSLSESPINPNATSNEQQTEAQAKLAAQQTIAARQMTSQPDGMGDPAITHPNLGASAPSGSGIGGLTSSSSATGDSQDEGKDDDQSDGKDKKKQSRTKKSKAPKLPKPPKMAGSGSKVPKFVPFLLGALVIVGGVVYGIMKVLNLGGSSTSPSSSSPSSPDTGEAPATAPAQSNVVLSYWGLWEPTSVMQEVLEDFEQQTGIGVDYRQQSHKDYRTRLQSAIEAGSGPDVFRYHATWVPMLEEELAPMPTRVMSVAEYEQTFYPIYSQQLQHNGQLVGIPLMYDGLGLYYNKDILQTANEEVPSTWGEVRVLADKLTVRNGNEVERGGIALGNTSNVEHFSDILGLLIHQNGGNPSNPLSGEVRDAIDFYALFAKSTPVYGSNLPNSTTAFARGDVAMMLAPSWRAHEVKHINPDLNFEIAPVPKLGESEYGWATYWAEGVSSKSPHADEAWQLLKYLSTPDVLRKLYSAQSEIRAFGEIYPRVDMASELANAEYVSAYLQDAPLARSGPLCSFTHDVGLNDLIIDYYADAINKASSQELTQADLQTLNQGVTQVMSQFGL